MATIQGLGKAVATVTGLVSAVCFLPSIPGAMLAGMETNPAVADHLVTAPLLFGVSAAAALACIARITLLRFVLAVVPLGVVLVRWLS
ncbi:hypothetical protein [Sphingomonas pituitosa]|uniref:hypothetical protein n=1 Tax=Sphingomonas pituitosa TaxID=99597 RepID=UPI000B169EFE|nr:hypothetical protein [Sphingomonas pituitosa]